MKNFNYYKAQIDRLNKKSEFGISIKLLDGLGNNTNQMLLNKESIKELRILLDELETELDKPIVIKYK